MKLNVRSYYRIILIENLYNNVFISMAILEHTKPLFVYYFVNL